MPRPAIVDELLSGPYPCCVTTLGPKGEPYAVYVWCAAEGARVTINAAEVRWLSNLRRDPRISLAIVDTGNILRHVTIFGRARKISEDTDYKHIDSLSQIYEGRRYQYSTPDQVPRYKVVVEPKSIRTLDHDPPTEEIR